jgi:hypothetical protein
VSWGFRDAYYFLTRLLEMAKDIDVDSAVETIVWKSARYYRISITIGDEHNDAGGRQKLFDGYSAVVGGEVTRRRGEVLCLKNLRSTRRLGPRAALAVAVHS